MALTVMKIFNNAKSLNNLGYFFKDRMSTFVQNLNPFTGKCTWELEDENYDFHQEIARSMYADMLHDTDRNQKYYKALKNVIDRRHAAGQKANVLDIGTGTGLLSMMAAKCNADSIIACEAFPPIAAVAKKVIADNGLSDKIKVIAKRSTDLEVGPGKDLEFRANILVTEVFDTELIGEGAIETFNHAKTYLLEPNADVIPDRGRVYVAIAESDFLASCNKFKAEYPMPNGGVLMPDDMVRCPGTNGVHDIQLSQLTINKDFTLLTQPVNIFSFDFGGEMLLPYDNEKLIELRAVVEGQTHIVLMWWELDMDNGGTVVTCAPEWIDKNSPWRDHWMQAVYHLPDNFYVERGNTINLLGCHDEFSFWFNIYKDKSEGLKNKGIVKASVCTCGAHTITSRTRICEMNLMRRWGTLSSLLVPMDSVVLFISDFSLLPLAFAKQGVKKVYCVEENSIAVNLLNRIIKHNNLEDTVFVLPEYNKELFDEKIDYVLSEPYFRKSIYPWDNLRSVFLWEMLVPEAELVFPRTVRIVAAAMSFDDLHKIKIPLDSVEGFDLRSFDDLVQGSSMKSDSDVETQPLWEYPGIALSGPVVIHELEPKVGTLDKKHNSEGSFNIKRSGDCHGVALWIDYFGDDTVLSGAGPLEHIVPGKAVRWDRTARQGVYLFRRPIEVEEGQAMEFLFEFQPAVGKIGFKFKPKPYI